MNLQAAFRDAPGYLRLLIVMRAIAIVALAGILYCSDCILEIHVPLVPVAGLIGFYALVDVATVLRLAHPAPVTDPEMFAQLLVDVALLSALLYFTGGARNPLALYYLLLLLYSSSALPPRLVWLLAAACVLSYVALHFFHVALPLPESPGIDRALDDFTRFLIYAFIAVLIAWFGIKLSTLKRVQREHVRAYAEKDARERYLVGLAALSTGTAHELSTPLSTISVLIGELRESKVPPPDWKDAIEILWGQVQLCRRSLSTLAGAAGVERLGEVQSVRAGELIADVAERLRALRPDVALALSIHVEDDLVLQSDHTLPQALMNFLNHAADVSPGCVELYAVQDRLNRLKLVIEVLDRGPGIAAAPRSSSGAGILIAQAALERFGGTVAISERRSGGTCVRIELPGFRIRENKRDEKPQSARR